MKEIKNLDTIDCPYCTAQSLEPTDSLTEIFFRNDNELSMADWVACRCTTCYNVVILDRKKVEGV